MKFEMKELLRDFGRLLYRFFSNRILWLFAAAAILFYVLVVRLFELQIVNADSFEEPPEVSRFVTRQVAAQRGTIYDRHGRPLAVNVPVFVAKLDPSVVISNEALLELALLFERNGEQYVDDFPICLTEREFTFTGTEAAIARQEYRFKDDMAVPDARYATAEETWDFLRVQFGICEELSDEDARRVMNLRAPIFRRRLLDWGNYTPVPFIIAYDISAETKAAIEEQNVVFGAVSIDIVSLRYYPAGRYVSHMIGYLRPITQRQLELHGHRGYTEDDLFGRAGLELSQEGFLRGTPGVQTFEVNSAGRRIGAPVWEVMPEPGHSIFLTIDLELQIQAFHILEDTLAEALISRLTFRGDPRESPVTMEEVFTNFVASHNLDIARVLDAAPGSHAYPMRRHIAERYLGGNPTTRRESEDEIQSIILQGIERGFISPAMMLLTLIGTEQISDPYGEIAERLIASPASAREVLIDKIRARELTPQMLNTDPATGSAVVVCLRTGDVLAAVSYPSFDNNRLVNTFDAEYFRHINALCLTRPMTNRPFMETRAPGSTFKMFTAVAALEEGVIGPNTLIFDRVTHTQSGTPSVSCWHTGGHGSINVRTALAVSCNYFFAECGFRLGNRNHPTRNTIEGITTLNRYMEFFGLNDPTGVEIGEIHHHFTNIGYFGNTMASPEFKIHRGRVFNPNAPAHDLQWRDGDTAQVTIGQGYNDYTPAQMARAMSIIGNRGVNHELRLVGIIENYAGVPVLRNDPTVVHSDIEISDTTWDAVIEGMRLVTEPGAGGTGVNVFRGFPIRVAGKTGTAEQIGTRLSHTAFGAFAPLDDPQIAIYVTVPFSATRAAPQPAARVARDIIRVALGSAEPQEATPLNTLRP